MDVPDERVVEAVERLIVGGVAITARALEAENADLTLMQWRVLVVAGDEPLGVHVGVVGERIGTSSPSASRIIRRLEDRGLIELVRDEADRRFTRVRLTQVGRDVRSNLVEHRRALIRAAFEKGDGPLPTDLVEALESIAATLSAAG